jgi:hypothetical protein
METRPEYMGAEVQFRGHLLREGFAQVPHAIIRSNKLSSNAKLVIYLLLSRAAKDGTSFEGHEGMARDTGLSVRSVQRSLAELKEHWLIDWQRHGQGKTNTYFVLQEGLERFVADTPSWQNKNGQLGGSNNACVADKGYPVEGYPVEEQPVGEGAPPLFEQDRTSWPQWYKTLREIPSFSRPFDDAESWRQAKGISEEHAEITAYALKGKWTAKKYPDAWATFQHWCKMPPLNERNGGNNGRREPGRDIEANHVPKTYEPRLDAAGNVILGH